METRIALAAAKGCDGIDPDNVDNYGSGSSFGATKGDAINYIKKMADLAHSYGMSMGLKNAVELVHDVLGDIEFAVNESCASSDGDCDYYQELTAAGKPVLHIEYVSNHTVKDGKTVISRVDSDVSNSDKLKAKYCFKSNNVYSKTISTTIKILSLNGWVLYCDDTWATTATTSDGVKKGLKDCPNGN
jgi:endo-alpha-1,4-polygalactosaminidase (GH114 family)